MTNPKSPFACVRSMIPSSGLVCGFILGGATVLYAILFFEKSEASYRLWYYTPAALLAGALLHDRFSFRGAGPRGYLMDGFVATICLLRPLTGWPPVSGHAVFSVYGLLSGATLGTRILALILFCVTTYAKIWLWHWDATLWPGLFAGTVAGLLYRRERARY